MKTSVSKCLRAWVLIVFALTALPPAFGQSGANRVMGEVASIDLAARQIALKTPSGEVVATFSADTEFLQVEPGATSLANAKTIALNDIALEDRVLARGPVSADGKSVEARQIIVMTKSAISQKQQREREEWAKRGVAGTVTSINVQAREITIRQHQRDGGKDVIIQAAKAVKVLRYAPDSVRFSDARASSLEEVKVDDQLRALGEKNADGTRVNAEILVSGAFRMAGGTIKQTDPSAGEIEIDDLPTKKPLTVIVNSDSRLKRVPPRLAQMLSRMGAPGGGSRGDRAAGESRPSAPAEARGAGGERPDGPNVTEMIERMPSITVTDLKPGDFVLVSSTKGADPSRVTAITLVAGAEAILAARSGATGSGPDMNIGLAADIFDFGIGMPSN